jgi:hypothetical protein
MQGPAGIAGELVTRRGFFTIVDAAAHGRIGKFRKSSRQAS